MPYQIYKVIHIIGIASVLTSLCIRMYVTDNSLKKASALIHGLGMVAILVGGFGLLARLGIDGFPGWVWAKLVIWLAFGGFFALVKRKVSPLGVWLSLIALTGVSASLAIYKPF